MNKIFLNRLNTKHGLLSVFHTSCSLLVEAQTQLNLSSEKERSAVEKHLTLQSRVGAMETQLVSLRQEKSQLLATLELERAKLETMEDGQQR